MFELPSHKNTQKIHSAYLLCDKASLREWKFEKSFRSAELVLFIFVTESTWRSYGFSKKIWKVFMRWKVRGFYGNSGSTSQFFQILVSTSQQGWRGSSVQRISQQHEWEQEKQYKHNDYHPITCQSWNFQNTPQIQKSSRDSNQNLT